MLRLFSCFGLGILFLWISPHLRNDSTNAIGACSTAMSLYAPYSYVASGIALIVIMMMAFKRGSSLANPRHAEFCTNPATLDCDEN